MIGVWILSLMNDALPKYLPWDLWLALDAPRDARGLRHDDHLYLPRPTTSQGALGRSHEAHRGLT